MSIKILFFFIITCQLVRAIERQHCPDVTDKDCGLAKGSKCQHKHVFACHHSSCLMNFNRRNATQGEIPWAVLVFNLAEFSVCTGSILNERWVLTAAHCLLHTKARHVEIYLGTKPALFTGPSYKIKQIKVPYLYRNDPTMGVSYDIALLELSKPIVFGPDVCSVCLPPLMYEHGEKETALFAGYGIYDKGGILQSGWVSFNRSHMYDNPYERGKGWFDWFASLFISHPKPVGMFICLWRTPPESGYIACHGDSGGPLVQFDREGRAVLIGILRGLDPKCKQHNSCLCARGVPTQKDIDDFNMTMIFTRVAFYVDWIEEEITGRNQCYKNGKKNEL